MFQAQYQNQTGSYVKTIHESESFDDVIDKAMEYLVEYTDYDEDDGEDEDEVRNILIERGYYIISYGDGEISIQEV